MMLKTLSLLTLLTTALSLPVENDNVQNPVQEEIQLSPQLDQLLSQPENSQLPQNQTPQLEDPQPPESKPSDDLKTEPTFWPRYGFGHGYGHRYGHGYGSGFGFEFGFPGNRRSFQYYPDYYYYRPRVNPFYYPQNYYLGGSFYW